MIRLKTKEEIAILREGGKKLAKILGLVRDRVAPEVVTAELNDYAYELIQKEGGKPSFLNYRPSGSEKPYPATLCVSINEEVVHGIPGQRKIKEGDVVALDLGMWYEGLCTDHALTLAVGEIDSRTRQMIETAGAALDAGIEAVIPGGRMGDVSYAIESLIVKSGFDVVRELSGHGVGHDVHEDPFVPNYGKPGSGMRLPVGLVLAIEPMVALGTGEVKLLSDGFTFVTADKKKSAHFEHTVGVTEEGVEILTKL